MSGFIRLVMCLFLVGLFLPALSGTRIDSLSKKLKSLPNDTNRVLTLNTLGFEYRHSKPELTYTLALQAYNLSRSLNYATGEARALATMAAAFKFLGDYAKSLKLYNQAREINTRIKDFDRVAVILNNTADLYIQQEEWVKGLATMRACFTIYNTLTNPQGSSEAVYCTNLAECFYHLNQLDSATLYLNRALPIATAGREPIITAIYYLLGDVSMAQQQTGAARSFYYKSIKTALEQDRYAEVYEGYYRLAGMYQRTGKRDSTLHFAKLALAYAQKATYIKGILKSSQQLSARYQDRNDTESLRYYKLAVAAKDSLYSQDKVKRLLAIDFEEKEQVQQMEVARVAYKNKVSFAVLFGVLAVFAGLALILYRNNRQKIKANLLLQSKNKEIEKTVLQLKAAQGLLAAKNAQNELLLKEIHHRVKNNLAVVSSLLALQSAKVTDPNVQEAIQASQNRVQSMGIIHQKLYQGEQLGAIEMRDYFNNLGESILDSFGAMGRISMGCSMPELVLDIDTAISVGLITNELLTNALKYAFVGKDSGTITISLTQLDDSWLLLQVADNGIGKQPEAASAETGFGTQLVDLLTRQLDGVLTCENQNGTLIKLRFKRPATV